MKPLINISQDSLSQGRDCKQAPPEYYRNTRLLGKSSLNVYPHYLYYANCQIYILSMSTLLVIYCFNTLNSLNSVGKLNTNSVKGYKRVRTLGAQHTAKNINRTLTRIRVCSHNRHSEPKSIILWEMTPCNPAETHRCLRRTQLPFQCRSVTQANSDQERNSKNLNRLERILTMVYMYAVLIIRLILDSIHRLVYRRQKTTTFRGQIQSPKRCGLSFSIYQTMDRVQNKLNSSVQQRCKQ
jgi:hypothetical protein